MNTDTNPLRRALDDLATTMTPNPNRLRQVRRRVDRRRHRRVATGAAVSAGAVAATLGLVTIPRNKSSLQSAATNPVPACSSVPQPVPHVSTTLFYAQTTSVTTSVANAKPPTTADPQTVDAKRAEESARPSIERAPDPDVAPDGTVEGKGAIESASANELVVVGALGHGDKATIRLRLSPDTAVTRYETPCAVDAQSAGSNVVFHARDNADGTYTATKVLLFD